MALGDGIRRNLATVPADERARLRDAILKLDTIKLYPDGVTYWDKQEEIHKGAHAAGADVHAGPAFLPWHRELVNRFEALIREVDPDLSLHYWDWTTDPRPLMTPDFMGGTGDPVGPPFNSFETTEGGGHTLIWRDLRPGVPAVSADSTITAATSWETMSALLQDSHNTAHDFIRGTIGQPHFSFHDPFVFLLHSNVDRLWATWQAQPHQEDRMTPATAYGSAAVSASINDSIEPWAGNAGLRPWAAPDNQQQVKTYKDPSVVTPACYDTMPMTVEVDTTANPGSVIHFNDVPEGETTARAAVFKIRSCMDVTLQVKTGPAAPYAVLTPGGTVTVKKQKGNFTTQEGRVWLAFTGQAPMTSAPAGTVVIHCVETNQDFTLTLNGNSIARPAVAVELVLDQSGSMDDLAGTGTTTKKVEILKEAAARFVELVEANNGVGLIRFDTNAYPVADPTYPGLAMTRIGAGGAFDPARAAALAAVQSHHTNPAGMTSIGDGVAMARSILDGVTGYDQKAMLIFTDGLENSPASIASVMSSVNNRTFAIGLGSENQVSVAALNALTNHTGGYLLLTGNLSASLDDYFRLSKYFLQILAGVTNNEIVLDPTGFVAPGQKVRIPFRLSETDISSTVVLLMDLPVIKMRLETPSGQVIDPTNAGTVGATYASGTNMSYYRFNLPMAIGKGAHGGTWNAVLEVDPASFKKYIERLGHDRVAFTRAMAHGARYSLIVQARSNLRLTARLDQTSLEPGADLKLRATLTEYDVPVAKRARVVAELVRPDKTKTSVTMAEVEEGVFEGVTPAPITGLYQARVVATGGTFRGVPFTRERTLTGVAVRGGDGPFPFGSQDPNADTDRLLNLIQCLTHGSLEGFLAKNKIDREGLLKCLGQFFRSRAAQLPEPGTARSQSQK